MTSLDKPRGNFRGIMAKDAVTGKMEPQYPRWKTKAKVSIQICFTIFNKLASFVVQTYTGFVKKLMLAITNSYKICEKL